MGSESHARAAAAVPRRASRRRNESAGAPSCTHSHPPRTPCDTRLSPALPMLPVTSPDTSCNLLCRHVPDRPPPPRRLLCRRGPRMEAHRRLQEDRQGARRRLHHQPRRAAALRRHRRAGELDERVPPRPERRCRLRPLGARRARRRHERLGDQVGRRRQHRHRGRQGRPQRLDAPLRRAVGCRALPLQFSSAVGAGRRLRQVLAGPPHPARVPAVGLALAARRARGAACRTPGGAPERARTRAAYRRRASARARRRAPTAARHLGRRFRRPAPRTILRPPSAATTAARRPADSAPSRADVLPSPRTPAHHLARGALPLPVRRERGHDEALVAARSEGV